jgi:predicted N-formylglutamate amidohydrolase
MYDPGAADIASALSERLECMAILTNFSKTIIDPSQSILSKNLIPIIYG